jgi:uncharacterized membrane protein YdbT with pleckstrin-like domain
MFYNLPHNANRKYNHPFKNVKLRLIRGENVSTSPNEKVIFATRFSKKLFAGPLLVSLVCIVAAIVAKSFRWEYGTYVCLGLLFLAVLVPLPALARYLLSEFVITNQRIIIRHGFIARRSYEMLLSKVESIEVDQTLPDRLFWGSGTLIITGTGGTKEAFPNVGGAIAFQESLNEMLHAG